MFDTEFNLCFSLYPDMGASWEVMNDFEGGNFEIPLKDIVQDKFKSILPTDKYSTYSKEDMPKLTHLKQEVYTIQKALIPQLRKSKEVWEQDFEWEGKWYEKTKNDASWLFECMKMLNDMLLYATTKDVCIEIRIKKADAEF